MTGTPKTSKVTAGAYGRRRFRLRFAALITAFIMIMSPAVLAGDGGRMADDDISGVSLFYNETPYKAGIEPMIIQDKYFIPVELFSCVPYITLSVVADENLFVMHNSRTGDEISALCAIERAWINGEIVTLAAHKTEADGGTYFYVDAEYITDVMKMMLDVITLPSGRTLIRLSDSEAKLGFERFLKATYPSEFGDAAYDEPKKTVSGGISLSFIGINEYTDQIIGELEKRKIPACFFLSYDDISTHPETVSNLISHGNSVGIYVDSYMNTAEADKANDLLCELTMRRTHYIKQSGYAQMPPAGSGYIGCGDALVRAIYETEYGYITACVLNGGGIMTLPQNGYTANLIDYALYIGAEFAGITFAR